MDKASPHVEERSEKRESSIPRPITGQELINKLHIPPKDKAEFVENLVFLRKNLGISQKKLAEIFGFAQTTIGMWEQANAENKLPPVYTLSTLAAVLDCPVEALCVDLEKYRNTLEAQEYHLLTAKMLSTGPEEIKRMFDAPRHVNQLTAQVRAAETTIKSIMTNFMLLQKNVGMNTSDIEKLKERLSMNVPLPVDASTAPGKQPSVKLGLPAGFNNTTPECAELDFTDPSRFKSFVATNVLSNANIKLKVMPGTILVVDTKCTDIKSVRNGIVYVRISEGIETLKSITNNREGTFFLDYMYDGRDLYTEVPDDVIMLGKVVLVCKTL